MVSSLVTGFDLDLELFLSCQDPLMKDIEETFLPWLLEGVATQVPPLS